MADNETGVSPNTPMQDLIGQMNYQAATSAAGLNLSKQMNNMLTAVNMNVGKVNASVTKVDGTLNKMYDMSKSINMNIGKVNANITALGKRHDDTNKILSDILKGIGGKPGGVNVYENVENKMEQKDVSSNIQIMTDTLKSIDETLKKFGTQTGNKTPQNSPNFTIPTIGAGAGIGAAVLSALRFFAGSVALPAAAAYTINMNQDMFGPESEKGKLLHEYMEKKKRENSEAAYRANREQFLKNSSAADGPVWQRYGRVGPNTTMMDMAVAGDIMNRHAKDGPLQAYNGFGSKIAAFPQVPLGTNTNRLSYNAKGYGDDILPYTPTPNDGLILGSMETKNNLDQQQANIEQQSKNMTKSELLYEATDVVYKATNIRFEASSIIFGGGQAGGVKAVGGSSGVASGAYSPYNNGGGAGQSFNDGSGDSSGSSASRQQLSSEQTTALQNLEKNGSYSVAPGGKDALAGIPQDVLKKSGISVANTDKGPIYTYTAPKNAPKVSSVSGIGGPLGKTMDEVMNVLMAGDPKLGLKGMTPNEAKYFMANFGSEGGFTGAVGDTSGPNAVAGGSHNIGQWNGDRLRNLNTFAKENGLDPKDPKTGALFTLFETQKGEKKDFWKKYQAAVASGNTEAVYDLLRDKYEVGLNGGSNRQNYDDTLNNLEKGKVTQGKVPLTDSVQGNMPMSSVGGQTGKMSSVGDVSTVHEIQKKVAATRKGPLTGDLKDVLAYATGQASDGTRKIESEVWSGGQAPLGSGGPRRGSTRHDLGRAADTKFFWRDSDGRKHYLDMNNPNDMPYLKKIISASASAGALGIGGAEGYMGSDQFHIGYDRTEHGHRGEKVTWGAGERSATTPKWLRDAAEEGWANPVDLKKLLQEQAKKTVPVQTAVGPAHTGGTYSGYGNFNAPKYVNPLEGANSPLASGVSSYDPNHPQAQSYVDKMKALYSPYRKGPNDRQTATDVAALQRSWSIADDLGVDFPLPAGVSAPMTNPIAGYEDKPDMVTSRNQEAIKRTESLRREEARRNNREAEESKRSKDKGKAAEAKKESHEPKNPHASSRKQMDSVLVRHNDWWKNWSATA